MARSIKEIEKAERELQKEKEKAIQIALVNKIDAGIGVLLADEENKLHLLKSKAFCEYEKSKAYVDSCKTALAESGILATNTYSDKTATVKISEDHKSCYTFEKLKEGASFDADGRTYIVAKFTQSFAGSTAELICLNSDMQDQSEKSTPYSRIKCSFNRSTKNLILPKNQKLSADTVVEIAGVLYQPVAFGVDATHNSYTMEQI